MLGQLYMNTLRGMNNHTASVDPNAPIPRPGQPTNAQITPLLGNAGPYVNQDIDAFNAQQTIPGTWNGQPIPQSPSSTSVNIPGYGNAPVTYSAGMGEAGFNGSEPPRGSGWRPRNFNQLFAGVLSQHMNESMSPGQWAGLLQGQQPQSAPQQQTAFTPAGMYGNQAMQMAGVRGPDSYPNGLLGGKRGAFRPGGK
jgi:hypothetical protein